MKMSISEERAGETCSKSSPWMNGLKKESAKVRLSPRVITWLVRSLVELRQVTTDSVSQMRDQSEASKYAAKTVTQVSTFFFCKNSRRYRGCSDATFCLTNFLFRFSIERGWSTVNSFFVRARFWGRRLWNAFYHKVTFLFAWNTFLQFNLQRWSTINCVEIVRKTVGRNAR